MCDKCLRDSIKTVELVHEQENLPKIGRCNVSDCRYFFIAPFYGVFKNQNETREVNRFSKMCTNRLIHENLCNLI